MVPAHIESLKADLCDQQNTVEVVVWDIQAWVVKCITAFALVSWTSSSTKSQLPCSEDTKEAPWRWTNLPATWLSCLRNKSPNTMNLQITAVPADIWLQCHARPWARTASFGCSPNPGLQKPWKIKSDYWFLGYEILE